MKKFLEFKRESLKMIIKAEKDSMWMNIGLAMMSVILALLLVIVGVSYCMEKEWIMAILEFMLAALQVWLGVFSVRRFFADKRSVNRYKAELDQVDSDLKLLESDGE